MRAKRLVRSPVRELFVLPLYARRQILRVAHQCDLCRDSWDQLFFRARGALARLYFRGLSPTPRTLRISGLRPIPTVLPPECKRIKFITKTQFGTRCFYIALGAL